MTAFLRARSGSILLAISATLVGIIVALIANYIDTGDRLHIGNTAGSLSVLVEIDDQRLLIGAGPTRSHAADFVGRSTRPWDREIDLLVLPGWDDFHATGALGLLERRDVRGIAVIGLPGEEPIWTLLEREAGRQDVPIRFLERSHRLELGDGEEFTMIDLAGAGQSGTWVRLEYHGARVDLVDTPRFADATPPSAVMSHVNDHVVINMRTGSGPAEQAPMLLARPEPFFRGDFEELDARFVANVPRNERVVLRLSKREIRVMLDDLDFQN